MGFVYVHGRDRYFRPCMVFHAHVLERAKHDKTQQYNIESINMAGIFLVEYMKKYMLIPGKVENWVVILDQRDFSLHRLGIRDLNVMSDLV